MKIVQIKLAEVGLIVNIVCKKNTVDHNDFSLKQQGGFSIVLVHLRNFQHLKDL